MTSTAFAPLPVPVMEDTMEMSSPAERPFDNDFDIDFDDYGGGHGGVHLTDDEHMIEDETPRPGTATDDMMADVDTAIPVAEAEMQDGDDAPQPVQQDQDDEELIDYEDEDVYEDNSQHFSHGFQTERHDQQNFGELAPQTVNLGFLAPTERHTEPEEIAEEIVGQAENAVAEPVDSLVTHNTETAAVEDLLEKAEVPKAQTPVIDDTEKVQHEEPDRHGQDAGTKHAELAGEAKPLTEPEAASYEDGHEGDTPTTRKPLPQLAGSLDVSSTDPIDVPPTPTDTGLHPMLVSYGIHEWPLFRSRSQPDGLLKDDNLVNVSLADLLRNCRERLALKLGEDSSDGQDLVLSFNRIGLMLVECTPYASANSLNDILEVYLQLHYNEHASEIPPLSMTLTHQLKFTSHLALLKQAAAGGHGISQYAANDGDTYGAEDNEDQSHGDLDQEERNDLDNEQEQAHEEADQEDDLTNEEQQHTVEAEDGHTNEYAEEYAHGHDELGQDEGEYQEDDLSVSTNQAEENPDGSYHEEGNDNHEEPDGYDETSQAEDLLEYSEQHHDEAAQSGNDAASHAEEDVKPTSIASSAIASAETADVTTEPQDNDGDDESSALLTEHDVEAYAGEDDTEHADELGLDLGSEDFLDKETAYEFDGNVQQTEVAQTGAHQHIEASENAELYGEDDHEQTDNLDNDAQDVEQPGEDEDQFHTAFDLLDDEEYGTSHADAQPAENNSQTHGQGPQDDEEVIGFDPYDDEEVVPLASVSEPLRSKRSFDEHAEEDELDDSPDPKKARSG